MTRTPPGFSRWYFNFLAFATQPEPAVFLREREIEVPRIMKGRP